MGRESTTRKPGVAGMSKIIAKVAKVLDNRTLVINAGSNKGVSLNMKFLISSALNSQVVDPDTNEIIGEVAIPKVKVEITRVDEKYSIAETYEYKTVNEGGSMPNAVALSRIFDQPKLVKKYKTFEIEDNQKKAIEKEKSLILIGDIAEQIEE